MDDDGPDRGCVHTSARDRTHFDDAVRATQDTRDFRRRMAARLDEIREQRNIPSDLLPRYTEYLSMLRDEAISFQEKGVDTLLTVEMMEGCLRDTFDAAILFAADEDYVPVSLRLLTHAEGRISRPSP